MTPHDPKLLSVVPDPVVRLEQRSDDELVILCRGGRREAFDVLVRRHRESLLRTAIKYLGEPGLADDAVQDAWLDVYRAVPSYRPQGRFKGFVYRCVLNRCRMVGRSARSRRRGQEDLARAPVAPASLPDERILALERTRQVDAALRELSERLKQVLVLRYAGGLSLREIGETLDLPVGTVKSRLFAGLAKLREADDLGDLL